MRGTDRLVNRWKQIKVKAERSDFCYNKYLSKNIFISPKTWTSLSSLIIKSKSRWLEWTLLNCEKFIILLEHLLVTRVSKKKSGESSSENLYLTNEFSEIYTDLNLLRNHWNCYDTWIPKHFLYLQIHDAPLSENTTNKPFGSL